MISENLKPLLKIMSEKDINSFLPEVKDMGVMIPYLISLKFYRKKYTSMKVPQLKAECKKNVIFLVWPDGRKKTKNDMMESLILFQLDKKKFLKNQQKHSGNTEPIVKRRGVSEGCVSPVEKSLKKFSIETLKKICIKFELEAKGTKKIMVESLQENLSEDLLEKVVKRLEFLNKK